MDGFAPARPPSRITYTGEVARRGYRLSKFFVSLTEAAQREAFKADPEGAMARAGLTEQEKQFIRDRDYNGMLAYGVAIYAMGKSGGALGLSLMDIGLRMRGQTMEEFMATRPLYRDKHKDKSPDGGGR